MSVDMVIWNGRWSEHRFPLTEYTASNFVSIWAISMLSDDCVSNTFKGGLSPCGMVSCKFISSRLRTTFSSYLSDVMLSQSAVSRLRSPVMTIVDSCSAAVPFSSFRKASRSFFLALWTVFRWVVYAAKFCWSWSFR